MQKIYIKKIGALEFNGEECETIEDAICELFKNDKDNILYDDECWNINREAIIENSSISYNIKNTDSCWVNLEFEIVKIDEEDIVNSKIKNAKIDII